jgi:phage terminase large subunit
VAHVQLPEKLKPLLDPYRFKIAKGGRGGTKSWAFANTLLILGTTKPIRWACLREVQKSIKDSVHKLLCDRIEALGLQDFYDILKTEIHGKNGTEFLFAGLSDQTAMSIKSLEGCDGAWAEEAQTIKKRSWDILIPTIRKPGSEIWVSFNPDLDTDDTWVRFIENTPPHTVVMDINYADNPWPSKELDDARDHMKRTDPVAYDNVWLGKPRAAAEGAIYANEIQALVASKRVCNLPYDPMLKVHTIWDIGYNDSTAIIFVQRNLSEIRVIDYLEDSHKTLGEYVELLKAKGYNYASDWLPWDGSKKRYRFTNPENSPEGILQKLQRSVSIVDEVDVENGIQKARVVFPRVYFDKDKTVRLRECLKRYARSIPVTTGEPAKPKHDEFSHGADAFRYMALSVDRMTNETASPVLHFETYCA